MDVIDDADVSGAREVKTTARAPAGILIVEDDDLVAKWLARSFEKVRPVTVASTVARARELLADPNGHWVALVADLGLPDGSGLELVREAKALIPTLSVLVLTGSTQPKNINGSFLLGASFLSKPTTRESLETFARRAIAAEGVGDARVLRIIETVTAEWELTDRETEILSLAVADRPRAELAEALGVGENTAKTHVKSLLRKSGARNLDHLVQQVLRRALAS